MRQTHLAQALNNLTGLLAELQNTLVNLDENADVFRVCLQKFNSR